jgi:hypothetical protein
MPWQRVVADVATEYDPATGRPTHPTVRILVPRQAGKTALSSPYMVLASLLRSHARVWITAQTQRDAAEYFRLEHVPSVRVAFGERTFTPRWSTGQESMIWRHNASTIRCFAPQRDALHGKQSDLVWVDEAWAFEALRGDDLLQAIGPTQATRPGAQVVITTAAGDVASTWLIAQLRQARAAQDAGDHTDVLIEYGVPDDLDDDAAADPDTVAAYHPAVGITIDASYLHAERRRLGKLGFVRAYGCRQVIPDPNAATAGAFDRPLWESVRWGDPIPDGDRVAFGVEVAHDRKSAAIVAASSSGVLEVIESRAGTAWVAARAIELAAKHRARVVIDVSGPSATVAEAITTAGHHRTLITLSGVDACTAAAAFSDAVTDTDSAPRARVRQHPDLDAAVRSASPRRVGDRWTWDRRDEQGAPVAPLLAGAFAWWGITHGPGRPIAGTGRSDQGAA